MNEWYFFRECICSGQTWCEILLDQNSCGVNYNLQLSETVSRNYGIMRTTFDSEFQNISFADAHEIQPKFHFEWTVRSLWVIRSIASNVCFYVYQSNVNKEMFSANKGESTQFIVSFWMIALWRNVEIISRFDFSAVKSAHMYCKMGVRDKFRLQWVAKSNLHQIIIGGVERLISWGEACTDVKIMFLKIWSVCLTFSLVKITFKTTFNFQICNFKCSRWYEMVKPKPTFFCTS